MIVLGVCHCGRIFWLFFFYSTLLFGYGLQLKETKNDYLTMENPCLTISFFGVQIFYKFADQNSFP